MLHPVSPSSFKTEDGASVPADTVWEAALEEYGLKTAGGINLTVSK